MRTTVPNEAVAAFDRASDRSRAMQFGWILAGSMVVESVFAWPGLGRLLMDSIRMLDIPAVAAGLSAVAIMFVLLNLLADILYTVLDPRVSHR